MTPEEKFLFDLNGYLVIKNVLSPTEVAELNAIADEKFPRAAGVSGAQRARQSSWGKRFVDLIDHPTTLPYLIDLIDPQFRLDHDYCIFMREGDPGMNLHGGEGHEGDHWYRYRNGRMLNGLCVLTFFLTPAGPGDGGFCCIPGTHKSHFIESIPRDVMRQERSAPYVVQPIVEAGDVLIFTEALVHGTRTWRAGHERRALLYKYSPGYSAWSQNYYRADQFEGLTDQQRRILEPPSVGNRRDVVQNAVG
jgi:ectoine hydroxylase-related dioxygenase (phytanoyl-CoA dioxygenase family)